MPGVCIEIPGVFIEIAGVFTETPGVSIETPGVYTASLYVIMFTFPYLINQNSINKIKRTTRLSKKFNNFL